MKIYRIYSAQEALDIAARVEPLDWPKGKASNEFANDKVKNNNELQHFDSDEVKDILIGIHARMSDSAITADGVVKHLMVPKLNLYRFGEFYDTHADAALMGGKLRTDVACTLFLNDDYDGGELCVGGHKFRGKPGECIVYECWRPHSVTPVTRGQRLCAITWMQSRIKDAEQRELIEMIRSVLGDIDRSNAEGRHYAVLSSIYGKLLRMWMEG